MSWQRIETAPRDGTPVLLLMKDVDELPERAANLVNIQFVGKFLSDGWDWVFSAPVGYGGIPDEWIKAWMPLPIAPTLKSFNEPCYVGEDADYIIVRGDLTLVAAAILMQQHEQEITGKAHAHISYIQRLEKRVVYFSGDYEPKLAIKKSDVPENALCVPVWSFYTQ
jgi:hypothetical protein